MNKFGIQIGNITIYYYSILILLGVIIGLYLALKEADKNGIGRSFISDLSFYVILFGIIGARIYYVVFNYSEYKNNFVGNGPYKIKKYDTNLNNLYHTYFN